jgi:creatinine amidohydrolase
MPRSTVRYDELLPREVTSARKKCPLAWLPIGTLEWHGPHNPFGLDTIIAHELALRAAARAGGLVMPSLTWGEPREFMHIETNPDTREAVQEAMRLPRANFRRGFMGGNPFSEQAHFYNDLLFHCYRQIESHGFRAIVVVVGHFPLRHFVNFTAAVFMRESGVKVECCMPHELIADQAHKLGGAIGDHGGRWETSVLLALRPDLVDLSRLDKNSRKNPAGVGGEHPRKATPEFGQRCVDAMVERMSDRARTIIRSL